MSHLRPAVPPARSFRPPWAQGAVPLLVLLFTSAVVHAQDVAAVAPMPRRFGGIFLSADVGRQNIIGGSLVGGVDVLQQDSRTVGSAAAGIRAELPIGLVIGAEFGLGRGDGNLVQDRNPVGYRVRYDNDSQTHVGATVGYVLGRQRRTLAFVYVAEVTRSFDVIIEGPMGGSSTFPIAYQTDEQGLLRYGIGIERAVGTWLSVRATMGSSRADFGDKVTNIEVRRPVDAGVGVVVRVPFTR